MTKGVSFMDDLPAADEIDDLHLVAVADDDFRKAMPFDDGEVVLDGDTTGVDIEPFQQRDESQRLIDFVRVAVEDDFHGCRGRRAEASAQADGLSSLQPPPDAVKPLIESKDSAC